MRDSPKRTAGRMSRELGDRGLASALQFCHSHPRFRGSAQTVRPRVQPKRMMRKKDGLQFRAVQRALPARATAFFEKSHRRQEAFRRLSCVVWGAREGEIANPKCSFCSRGEARTARCNSALCVAARS